MMVSRPRSGTRRDHSAQAETGALGEGQPFGVLDQLLRDRIQPFDGHQVHAAEVRNVQAVFARKVVAKILGIDFHRAKPLEETEAKKPPDGRAGGRGV
jgi:hypothetical protein